MKQGELMRHVGLIIIVGLILWVADVPQAFGGGSDPALPKAFRNLFPAATSSTKLSSRSRLRRAPQMLEVWNGETLLGYGVMLKVKSRSGPFRMLVAVSPEENVLRVQIPDYPHRRGRAIRKQAFLDQFRGVAYGKPLKLGEQVDGVSGATSSATAITGGVRRALVLVHQHRQKG